MAGKSGKELCDLCIGAQKAPKRACQELLVGGARDEALCLEILQAIEVFPVSLPILVKTRVAKLLKNLTMHTTPKIADRTKSIIRSWKKFARAEVEANSTKHMVSKDCEVKASKVARKLVGPSECRQKKDLESSTPPRPPLNHKKMVEPTVEVPTIKRTKNETRDLVAEKVRDSLLQVREEWHEDMLQLPTVNAKNIARVAVAVEREMFKKWEFNNNKKIRSIIFNLKDKSNLQLRREVLFGEIKPEQLVNMSSKEMASRTLCSIECSKCKEKMCTHFQMETRSADESTITYVTCIACNMVDTKCKDCTNNKTSTNGKDCTNYKVSTKWRFCGLNLVKDATIG